MRIEEVEEILNECKELLIKDKKVDALSVEDLIGLHHDACILASAMIIAEAICRNE